jgi:carboxypeptidase Q
MGHGMRAPLRLIACASIFAAYACAPRYRATTARASAPATALPTSSATPKSAAPIARVVPAATPPAAIAAIQRAALASSGASDVVQSLTAEVGPRLAGSPGDRAAVAWALRTMTARGLANVHSEEVTVPHWERGAESAAIVAPFPHKLAVAALGGSVATPDGGVEAEVVEVDSLEALTKLDDKAVAGKIVFVNRAMRRAKDGAGYGEAVGVRSKAAIEAAKKGAVAALIRSIGTDHDRLPHTGAQRRDKSGHAIPAAALSVPDAELLHQVIALRETAHVSLTLGARWLPDAKSANVVGEVRGREKPDEIVLLGAHLDSWDLGTGAVDDGAGCGVVIEAGRILASLPENERPRRTVRFVLFAAEENALAGGAAYAKAHAADVAHHVAALEADSGTDRVYALRYLGAPEERARFATLAPRFTSLGIALGDEEAGGGADISPLRALGVPVIDLEQDFTHYFDLHHTANDTFDKIDKEALSQVAAAFATMAYSIAEMDGDFGRIPQAKREQSW